MDCTFLINMVFNISPFALLSLEVFCSTKNIIDLWYFRLGHLSVERLNTKKFCYPYIFSDKTLFATPVIKKNRNDYHFL